MFGMALRKIVIVLMTLELLITSLEAIQFTKLECKSLDKHSVKVLSCHLEPNRKNVTSVSTRIRHTYGTMNNISGYFKYMKKTSDSRYKLFLPPVRFDLCKFMEQEFNPMLIVIFRLLKPYTNLNHTCPYTDDEVIVDKFSIDGRMLFWLPIQKGDYAMFIMFYVYGRPSISVNAYFNFPANLEISPH